MWKLCKFQGSIKKEVEFPGVIKNSRNKVKKLRIPGGRVGGGIKKVRPESPLFGFFLPIVNFYAEKNMSSFIHSFIHQSTRQILEDYTLKVFIGNILNTYSKI